MPRKLSKRWLSHHLNSKMVYPIIVLAIFVAIVTIASFQEGELAKSHKLTAEEANSEWIIYNQIYSINPENIAARDSADQFHNESITQNNISFDLDFVSGVYQVSIQCAIVSLILFLAAFSIKSRRALGLVNIIAFALLVIAVVYFIFGFGLLITVL